MSSRLGRLATFAAASAALFGLTTLDAREAHAFCRTTTTAVPANYNAAANGCFAQGLLLFWKTACVNFSMNQAASSIVPLDTATKVTEAAFATWTAVQCDGGAVGVAAVDHGPVQCAEVEYHQNGPNQNVIVFRDDSWPYTDQNNTLGLTTVTFNADTGEIYDADMEINAAGKNLTTGDPVPAGGYDLLSVITHEAGHFLGLAHATDAGATMFASYKTGTSSLRTLSDDDKAGICAIYPDATKRIASPAVFPPSGQTDSSGCDKEPRHGFSTGCEENAPPKESSKCEVGPGPASSSPPFLLGVVLAGGVAAGVQRRRAKR